ncbi:hypothetical protein F5Y13DRAFT_198938 [Hypoxylon sp. FL1857]|nr:hypothetical protein F5Y13DRAFT_198938 [Hypoxylon sp. FL1857]
MSSSGKASSATFANSPPSNAIVGQEFRIKVRAPSSNTDKNGAIGFVSLACAPSRSGGLAETSYCLEGSILGNWERKGNCFDTMEFGPIKVTHPGRYYLRVHFYSDPMPRNEGEGQDVELMGVLESETFQVHERGLFSKGSKGSKG